MTQQERRAITFPIRFVGEDQVPILFANQMFARVGPDGLIITFAQAHGPYQANLSEDDVASIPTEGLPAHIVSRVAIPRARARRIVEILSRLIAENPPENDPEDIDPDEFEDEQGENEQDA